MQVCSELSESLTLKFAQTARQLKEQGRKIISLGLGEPDFNTPDYIIDATNQAMRNGFTGYSDSMGLPDLRERISYKLKSENACNYEPNQIIVTPGAKQAIFLALAALLQPGDEVINFTPYYVSYVPIAKIAEPNCIIHHIKLNKDDFSIDFEQLEKAISHKTKVLLLNTPNNPSGKIFTKEELRKISELSCKYNFYVIADEIYEKLCFGDEEHISIASFDNMLERVFTINGFSKAYAMTGWRIGYIASPKAFVSTINKLQQHINTNTCTFVQKGALAALNGQDLHIQEYNIKLKSRFELLRSFIDNQNIISCRIPKAGFFAFADISKVNMNSNEFCSVLLDRTGIAITPGIACGKDWDDHIRISLAADEMILDEALRTINDFIHTL
jgi:aspartate aminotransferase